VTSYRAEIQPVLDLAPRIYESNDQQSTDIGEKLMMLKRAFSLISALIIIGMTGSLPVLAAPGGPTRTLPSFKTPAPTISRAVAFDVSPALRDLAKKASPSSHQPSSASVVDIRPERGPVAVGHGFTGDGALQGANALAPQTLAASIPSPLANFEGASSLDNFNVFGFRVNPPDPDGAVGLNHYVELINLTFSVFDKQGNQLLGPMDIGSLWQGFAVPDCSDPSGDPIVIYDQFTNRWFLTQFTTRTPIDYNCVAVSTSPDPTGTYFRYAFTTGENFPDYPKYGNWKQTLVITTREFGNTSDFYGIGVYALQKSDLVAGKPNPSEVKFLLDSAVVPLNLIGDGLLPADIDGSQPPKDHAPIPLIGTQDDGASYGATFDALNVWEMSVDWSPRPSGSISLAAQLPVAAFDSVFPCAPTSRDCLPQPGITNRAQYLDVLSYRQRPTWRLAYRNFGQYESMVTDQSVEARPGIAGMRWYEIRRVNGQYSLYQQGTFAPDDGVNRWMGSIAEDAMGNMALGYSVVNGTDVFPGIRYTARFNGDPLGQMTLGEGTIIDGTGVQTTTNSRWGDYTAMTIDPTDDCTFWYVNEYYTAAGQASSPAGWQTRIASFKLPGCVARK
jgi:hypothetical protein